MLGKIAKPKLQIFPLPLQSLNLLFLISHHLVNVFEQPPVLLIVLPNQLLIGSLDLFDAGIQLLVGHGTPRLSFQRHILVS